MRKAIRSPASTGVDACRRESFPRRHPQCRRPRGHRRRPCADRRGFRRPTLSRRNVVHIEAVEQIRFANAYYRRDIGYRAVARQWRPPNTAPGRDRAQLFSSGWRMVRLRAPESILAACSPDCYAVSNRSPRWSGPRSAASRGMRVCCGARRNARSRRTGANTRQLLSGERRREAARQNGRESHIADQDAAARHALLVVR